MPKIAYKNSNFPGKGNHTILLESLHADRSRSNSPPAQPQGRTTPVFQGNVSQRLKDEDYHTPDPLKHRRRKDKGLSSSFVEGKAPF